VGSAGFRGLLIDDPSVWSVKIWNKTDVQSSGVSEEQGESEFIKWLDSLEKKSLRICRRNSKKAKLELSLR